MMDFDSDDHRLIWAPGNRHPKTDGPHVWVQWKGTDVCLDFVCECGAYDHIDGFFIYRILCVACGRVYSLPETLPLVQLTKDEVAALERLGRPCTHVTEPDDPPQDGG